MRDFLVYLAGPISGLTYDNGQNWRQYATNRFPKEIHGISPLRAKEELRNVGVIEQSYDFNPLTTDQGITARDRFDCTRSDLVLFNLLGAKSVSVGTCIEFGWADSKPPERRNLVLVMEKSGNIHEHPMIRGIVGWRTDSLDHGIELVERILMPSGYGTSRAL